VPSTGSWPSDEAEPGRPALSTRELEVLLRVAEVLRRVEFGSVLIVVHEGKVVQIEMAEKIRLR
jgi:hypothetical protein